VNQTWSIYRLEDGKFIGYTICLPDEAIEMNTPEGHAFIVGHHDHLSKRVDIPTGLVVDDQPPSPSADHEWNADTKRWQLTASIQAKAQVRAVAIARIAELDAWQHRHVRDMLLGGGLSVRLRLQAIHDEIATLSADL
jgi:hypothetical protein